MQHKVAVIPSFNSVTQEKKSRCFYGDQSGPPPLLKLALPLKTDISLREFSLHFRCDKFSHKLHS